LEDRDDGIFWICVEDFRKYYEGVGVCKVHLDYSYNSFTLNFKDGEARRVVHLEVDADCHCYVSVNQRDDRCFFDTYKDYKYAYPRLLIA